MELLLIRMATTIYAVASLCALPAVLWSRARFRGACTALALVAAVLQCVAFAEAFSHTHRFAPTGLHEVQAALAC